ncbi:MAG: matrixin family metalloprotease, partial [Pseudomonadota bacterium]
SVPQEAYGAIRSAMEHWNVQLGKEVFKIEIFGVGGVNEPRQDNVNVIYWMTNWEQDRQTEQARTTIYWTGSRIYEADVRINANFPFHYPENDLVTAQGELDQSSIAGVDFESLMVHELGHAIGLAHREEASSVMQTMLASGVDRRQLSKADVNSVKCEYEQYKN